MNLSFKADFYKSIGANNRAVKVYLELLNQMEYSNSQNIIYRKNILSNLPPVIINKAFIYCCIAECYVSLKYKKYAISYYKRINKEYDVELFPKHFKKRLSSLNIAIFKLSKIVNGEAV